MGLWASFPCLYYSISAAGSIMTRPYFTLFPIPIAVVAIPCLVPFSNSPDFAHFCFFFSLPFFLLRSNIKIRTLAPFASPFSPARSGGNGTRNGTPPGASGRGGRERARGAQDKRNIPIALIIIATGRPSERPTAQPLPSPHKEGSQRGKVCNVYTDGCFHNKNREMLCSVRSLKK